MALPAVPGRDSIREEWFVCTVVSKGFIHYDGVVMVEQLSSKQRESVSKLVHIAQDQEAEKAEEVGSLGKLRRLSCNDLLPQAAPWFLKIPQAPQIAPLVGNTH